MNEILQNIDWEQAVRAIWTIVLLPLLTWGGTKLQTFAQEKKIDRYTDILYQNVIAAVKDVYETSVRDLKGTPDWTPEKQNEVKTIAKNKAVQALSNSAYQLLKAANEDFEEWLDSLIGTALYDLKHPVRSKETETR